MWLREPDEPVKVREVVDDDTYVAAVNVSCPDCPGLTCRLVGETDTPDGSPVTPIVTGEVNPLEPVTEIETVADEPAVIMRLALETERLKSGLGGDGVCCKLPPPPPPPHPATPHRTPITNRKVAKLDPQREVQITRIALAIYFPSWTEDNLASIFARL